MADEIFDLSQGWNSLAAEMLHIGMQGGPPANELAFYERRIRENGISIHDAEHPICWEPERRLVGEGE